MKKTEYDNIMANYVNNKRPINTPKDQLLNVLYPLQTSYRNAENNIQKQISRSNLTVFFFINLNPNYKRHN